MARIIVNGNEAVFGRMASYVAKELLKGNSVEVINCESVIFSGKLNLTAEKILAKIKMGQGASLKGPKYIRSEDRLLKRMIRGMLPWDRPKGREAYKRLRCHIGAGDLNDKDLKGIKKFEHKKPMKHFTIKELVGRIK